MYLRDHIIRKLENVEAKLKHIEFHNNRGNRNEVEASKRQCEDLIEEIKSSVLREPITANEQNRV